MNDRDARLSLLCRPLSFGEEGKGGGRARSKRIIQAILVALCCLLSACQTDHVTTSDGRPMPPPPRQAPVVPADALVNTIVTQVGAKGIDTNGNGYPDEIRVISHLLSDPHPTPLFEPGTFVYQLFTSGDATRADASPLAAWTFSPAEAQQARTGSTLGPAYAFRLSLLQSGAEKLPPMLADLTCRFEPADGREPVRSRSVYSIQLGRVETNRPAPVPASGLATP